MKKLLAMGLTLITVLTMLTLFALPINAGTYGDLTYEISGGTVVITDCDMYASGTLTIPSTIEGYPVTKIADEALQNTYLSGINIPDSVTYIGQMAFFSSDNLTSIVIPDSVTYVGSMAFSGCPQLTSVVFGAGVDDVGMQFASFSGKKLTKVEIRCPTADILHYSFTDVIPTTATIYGYTGSTAETYAENYGYNFISIGSYHKCSFNQKNTASTYLKSKATCSSPAVYYYSCTCGEKGTSTFTSGNASGHKYTNACDTSCNTCGATRTISHTYTNSCDTSCNTCGYTRTITHSYKTEWSQDGSKHWHECTVCGAKKDESAHKPGAAATETTPQTCTVCGYVIKAALGHTHKYDTEWSKDGTAHWHECDCGAKKDSASHQWNDGKVTKEPTTSAQGERTFTCTVCSATRVEKIDKLAAVTTEPVTTEPAPETTPDVGGEVTDAPVTADKPVTDAPVTTLPTTTEKTPITAPDTNASVDISADNGEDDNGTLMIVIAALGVCLIGAMIALIVVATRKKPNS